MESAARMNQNKTVVPHLPFHSSPNGDTIIIHYSFFIIHLLFSIFTLLAWAPAKPRAQTRTDKPITWKWGSTSGCFYFIVFLIMKQYKKSLPEETHTFIVLFLFRSFMRSP